MFVGHAMLAFALVAGGAHRLGHDRERALVLGLLGGAFATIPDVDMLYALSGLVGESGAVSGFWSASTLVHRVLTHSLPVGLASAVGVALWARGISAPSRFGSWRLAGLAVLVGVVLTGISSGPLGLAVMAAFVLAGLAVATAAVRSGGFGPRSIGAAALVGLLSHPFGDLFTGEPPLFLYPFDVRFLDGRVLLSTDPTLHLLGTFGLELATIWLAVLVYCRLADCSVREHVQWRATLGIVYVGAVLALPAPTVDSAYRFVVGVLGVGIVGPAPLVRRAYRPGSGRSALGLGRPRPSAEGVLTPVLTALATITVAALSFGIGYALL
ncbi:metal-dependent hydrolase [Halalkalicoccus subterraneus]|uniref:metal-dependent hydrolase n=1 Tax=Halalkalicoccus subterraneus TaxID=2675002 RepID=UPI000EFA768E|nr:metal-dependent hydrolase [Halalkalicoccus subterraneus]